ncbi:DMT family transporter [Ciceribacter sp. L1K22]|uniref:DMT family transporter n=1 Tax=Ciceribacter sp. L1K22 TaxID=2820275 RepID=UPI001ABE7E45|nr:DMT family transporter [Ciceribacter sp. L1K22]MBO3760813.1 DMT family transporter [Ciceribacter sp. L1K22]
MTCVPSPAPVFHRRWLWPVLALVMIVSWSSGFIGLRYANEEAGMATVLFWRTLMSGLILLPFALMIGPRMTARGVAEQMVFGVAAVVLYLGGFAVAIAERVPTGLVALISDMLPLAIAALSQPVLGEKLSGRQWAGTAVAVGGVFIVSFDSLTVGEAPLWAYGLTVASTLVFALASVMHKKRPTLRMPIHQALSIHTLTGAAVFGLVAWWQEALMPPLTAHFAFGIGWLVLLATFAAYGVYYTALRLYPVAQVSAAIYLSPPVTMIWALMLFSEPLTPVMFAGLAVTLAGVAMTWRG